MEKLLERVSIQGYESYISKNISYFEFVSVSIVAVSIFKIFYYY